jgi:hypothetical protein
MPCPPKKRPYEVITFSAPPDGTPKPPRRKAEYSKWKQEDINLERIQGVYWRCKLLKLEVIVEN